MHLRNFLIGLAAVGLLGGCAANRQTATRPSVQEPAPVIIAEAAEEAPQTEETDTSPAAIAYLMSDAQAIFERGRSHYEAREFEMGRVYFDEALSLLRRSGYSFRDFPELEQKYHELEQDILRIQVLAQVSWEEPPLPLDEFSSPLDELAALDLYTVEVDPALEHMVSEELRRTAFDFPVVVNTEVLKLLDFYQNRGRKNTEEALQRSGRYLPMMRAIFREEGLPQDLVYMAHAESLFKPKAFSRARARGIWQFMSGTARLYDLKVNWWLDERLDVVKATRSAARFLKALHEEFGDWYLALAAYNGGPGRVGRVIKRHGRMDYWKMVQRRLLPRETRNYVPSILASIFIYRNPELYGFQFTPDPPLEYEEVPVSEQVDVSVIADLIGVDRAVLTDLNLELIRGVTPGTGGHNVKVPPGTGAKLMAGLADLPPSERLRFQTHRVQRGETLSLIAGRYGVSIDALAGANNLKNIHRLSLGQELMVPLSGAAAVRGSAGSASSRSEIGSMSGTGNRGRHIVRRGDSLYKIARAYGIKLVDLFRWNNLRPGALIHPGQEIRLSD